MDREKLEVWCEKGILATVLAILVAGPLLFGGTGEPAVLNGTTNGWHFLPLMALTICVLILWMIRIRISHRTKFLWPPICWAVLAFVIYATLRYLQSDLEYTSRQEVVQIWVYAFLFWAILNNLHGQEATRTVGVSLVFLGMALAAYAICQVVIHHHWVWNVPSPYPGRGSGTFLNPNNLAGFLEMILPLSISYLLAGRLSHVTKVIIGYAALVILAGILATISRAGMAATGLVLVALCITLMFQRNYRLKAILLAVGLVGLGYFGLPKAKAIQNRFSSSALGNVAMDTRRFIWSSAGEMWHDHFLFGVGPGLFDSRFRLYRAPEVQMRPLLVHNDYLNALTDYGVVGAAAIMSAWVLLGLGVVGTWRYARGAQDDFSRKKSSKFAFLLGAVFGLAAILIHSAGDFNLHIPANAILAVTLMALLSSQWRFATERYWFTAGPKLKAMAYFSLGLGVLVLGVAGLRAAREQYWLTKAEPTLVYSYARIAALTNAFEADSKNFDTAYAIAECYLRKSKDGPTNYVELAHQAMDWYRKGMTLNPRDAYNFARYGECLDWIEPQTGAGKEDSSSFFNRANQLDPNGAFTTTLTGRHYVEIGDYAAARTCFQRSLLLDPRENSAEKDLAAVDWRMHEKAGSK